MTKSLSEEDKKKFYATEVFGGDAETTWHKDAKRIEIWRYGERKKIWDLREIERCLSI
jgi:hypothetical protein